MRAFLASSVAVVCATALALPLAAHASAAGSPAPPGSRARADLPGSTRSLPLTAPGGSLRRPAARDAERGVTARNIRPFALVGVVWDDPAADLRGRVQVRTRAAGTGVWSAWRDLQTHNDDAPDAGSPERRAGRVRGSTAPLWVGNSDGVQARVRPEAGTGTRLPAGLRLELVDPGEAPTGRALTGRPPATDPAGGDSPDTEPPDHGSGDSGFPETETPSSEEASGPEPAALGPLVLEEEAVAPGAAPGAAPRPRIVTRAGWGADEKLRESKFSYTKTVKAAFVHHSATGNNYSCGQVPAILRGIYRYHVKSSGWRDIGYNFAVDKCGNVYEGRAGGVARAVLGAHTLGFNSNTMGVAVLGTYGAESPPQAALDGLARLTAWKLGLFGRNPNGSTTLVSAGSNKYRQGVKVKLKVVSGHRDGFVTDCPGGRLYSKLGSVRSAAARLQGR
ncbi:peptidoglycan recognition protein family protein [Streptomyces pactum]|uniref:peptidoglycan recognition protein family protein n=1 Tax=Streptomyces pactum TaxID=68249 RepID=UPI0036F71B6A